MTTEFYHAKNRAAWNQAAAAYRRSQAKTIEFLRAGNVSFCKSELPFLKKLLPACETAIHLQCAGGEDTLSLLNLGARRVVGIDISDEMLRVAQTISDELGASAEWICCDVLNAPENLNESADLIYTGRGAVIWIHDLQKWAATIARLLKPTGRFYLFEGHPITYFFDPTADKLQLDPNFQGYFSRQSYASKGWTPEYVGESIAPGEQLSEKYERAWAISEILNALLENGLRLEHFGEHAEAYWNEFPNLPNAERILFPNTYSLLMSKYA